jgi:hypothetical protein
LTDLGEVANDAAAVGKKWVVLDDGACSELWDGLSILAAQVGQSIVGDSFTDALRA